MAVPSTLERTGTEQIVGVGALRAGPPMASGAGRPAWRPELLPGLDAQGEAIGGRR
jgi:hypothetical protein